MMSDSPVFRTRATFLAVAFFLGFVSLSGCASYVKAAAGSKENQNWNAGDSLAGAPLRTERDGHCE